MIAELLVLSCTETPEKIQGWLLDNISFSALADMTRYQPGAKGFSKVHYSIQFIPHYRLYYMKKTQR